MCYNILVADNRKEQTMESLLKGSLKPVVGTVVTLSTSTGFVEDVKQKVKENK